MSYYYQHNPSVSSVRLLFLQSTPSKDPLGQLQPNLVGIMLRW